MLSNDRIEKLALFFYFMFLDEGKAQAATFRAIRKMRAHSTKLSNKEVSQENIVKIAHGEAIRSFHSARATGLAVSSGHIILPEKSNWGPWFEFRKVADLKDFEAVLLHNISGFTIEQIAAGLEVAEGTIRYRLGHGLRQLGKICLSGNAHA